jgi:ornithine carbamoyltransferase
VKGRIAGLKVAYIGDGNNVARSLLFAGVQLGAEVRIATPPVYELDEDTVDWATSRCVQTGGKCAIAYDPEAAVSGADVVYTDVWTSMGQEAEAETRSEIFRPYQVNTRLFGCAKPDAIFMHCLPAHRGDEVTDEVIDSPRSFVFPQAENRLHAQKAIMLELMSAGVPERAGLREPALELVE